MRSPRVRVCGALDRIIFDPRAPHMATAGFVFFGACARGMLAVMARSASLRRLCSVLLLVRLMLLRRRFRPRLRLRVRLLEMRLRLRLRARLFDVRLRLGLRARLFEVRLRLGLRARLLDTRLSLRLRARLLEALLRLLRLGFNAWRGLYSRLVHRGSWRSLRRLRHMRLRLRLAPLHRLRRLSGRAAGSRARLIRGHTLLRYRRMRLRP